VVGGSDAGFMPSMAGPRIGARDELVCSDTSRTKRAVAFTRGVRPRPRVDDHQLRANGLIELGNPLGNDGGRAATRARSDTLPARATRMKS